MKKLLIITILVFTIFIFAFSTSVSAQFDVCDFLPCAQVDPTQSESDSSNQLILTLFRFGVSLIFVGIIIYGIFIILKAAVKIIRSEGNEEQLQEGFSAVKSVFIGIAMLVAGIVGLLVMSFIFGASGIFRTEVEQPGGVNIPIITN